MDLCRNRTGCSPTDSRQNRTGCSLMDSGQEKRRLTDCSPAAHCRLTDSALMDYPLTAYPLTDSGLTDYSPARLPRAACLHRRCRPILQADLSLAGG